MSALRATFVGGGNMATALIGGLVARGAADAQFRVIEPSATQRDRLRARYAGVHLHDAVTAGAVSDVDVVVLAVKPQHLRDAAAALAPHRDALPLVLSIAAGIRIGDLARWLDGHRRIVRAMPNTPALIGRGISGVYADPSVDAAARAVAAEVLDAVTGISGSGPAYVFYFIEALEQAAIEQGFDRAAARRLAYATFAGAVALAQGSSDEPATLRANVTSKGGTTERGLQVLDARGVAHALRDAVAAATARARELGDEFGKP